MINKSIRSLWCCGWCNQRFELNRKFYSRLGTHEQSEITPGKAIAGMIFNGLGFVDRPLYLTPQFFENKLLEILFRPDVKAEYFNSSKLVRTLDKTHFYGYEALFNDLAESACRQEKVDCTCGCERAFYFAR